MAVPRYGPPDDPNHYPDDEPTAYANYGNHGGYGPPPGEPVPWFRNTSVSTSISTSTVTETITVPTIPTPPGG